MRWYDALIGSAGPVVLRWRRDNIKRAAAPEIVSGGEIDKICIRLAESLPNAGHGRPLWCFFVWRQEDTKSGPPLGVVLI